MADAPASQANRKRYPHGTRPTRDIYDIVGYTSGGAPIRVIDRAVDTIRIGGSVRDVADRCGLDQSVVREWLRRGTAVSADIFGGRRLMGDLTRHERKCFEFVQLTAQAEADGKAYLLGLAEQVARGGFVVETVTEKVDPTKLVDGKPVVLERTTKRTLAAPDGPMIRWRLAARWPAEFRNRVEITGAEGGPVQVDASPIIDRLLSELERIATNTAATDDLLGAIDVPSEPAEPAGLPAAG